MKKWFAMLLLFSMLMGLVPPAYAAPASASGVNSPLAPKGKTLAVQSKPGYLKNKEEQARFDDGSLPLRSEVVPAAWVRNDQSTPSERLAIVRDQFTPQMKMVMAFDDAKIFQELTDAQRRKVLSWNRNQVNQVIGSLKAADKKALERFAPATIMAYDYTKDQKAYRQKYQSLFPKPAKAKEANPVKVQSLATDKTYTITAYNNEYRYAVQSDELVDPVYRTANRRVVDLALPGKDGLDVTLVRSYNSLDSKVMEPSFKGNLDSANGYGNAGTERTDIDNINGFIATGWSLQLPAMQRSQTEVRTVPELVYCVVGLTNPCHGGQTTGTQTVYRVKLRATETTPDFAAAPKDQRAYESIVFTLDDGSQAEVRKYAGYGYELYRNPYQQFRYENINGKHYLTVNHERTYIFDAGGRTVIKRNYWDCNNPVKCPVPATAGSVTYAFHQSVPDVYDGPHDADDNILITDSYGRKITIFRGYDIPLPDNPFLTKWVADSDYGGRVIRGFKVEDGNQLVKHMQYRVTRGVTELSYVNGNLPGPTYTSRLTSERIGYWQLDKVVDVTSAVAPLELESYQYYSVDSTKLADFNFNVYQYGYSSDGNQQPSCPGACAKNWKWADGTFIESDLILTGNNQMYGEIAYLLLKDVQYTNGLTVRLNYQSYTPNWTANLSIGQQEQYRGTTRLYTDEHALQYIGYHAVERVDLLYSENGLPKLRSDWYTNHHEDHGWTFHEVWKHPKADMQRLANSSRFGDRQTVSMQEQVGGMTNRVYQQFTLHNPLVNAGSGGSVRPLEAEFVPAYTWTEPWNYVAVADGGTRSHEITAYTYGSVWAQPTKVETYAGNVSDVQDPAGAGNVTSKTAVTSVYDVMYGYVKEQTDPQGNKTVYTVEVGVVPPSTSTDRNPSYLYRPKTSETTFGSVASPEHHLKTEYSYYSDNDANPYKRGELWSTVTTETYKDPVTGAERKDKRTSELTVYDADRRPVQVRESAAGDSYGRQPLTTVSTYRYTNRGQLAEDQVQARLSKADAAPSVIATRYAYDVRGRLTLSTYPDGMRESRSYDGWDRVTKVEVIPLSGAKRTTSVAYHDAQRRVTVTMPDGEQVDTFYTPFGKERKSQRTVNGMTRILYVHELADGERVDATRPYNSSNRQTSYTYDSLGRPRAVTDSLGTTTYAYANVWTDAAGRSAGTIAQTISPDGKVTTTYTNALGQTEKVEEKTADGAKLRTTTMTYTRAGKVKTQTVSASTGASEVTHYGYDAAGNLIYLKDAEGTEYRYVYNRQGQLIGHQINGEWQAEDEYNEVGWLLAERSATGETEHYQYRSNGQLDTATDKQGRTTTYTYTPYNEPDTMTIRNNDSQQTVLYTQTQTYDPLTRLVRKIQNTENPNTSQARTEVLGYGYDQWKRQTAQYVAGKNYRFQYNELDQLTGVQYPAAGNQPAMNVSYTYDAAGRMQTVSTPGMGTATYQYTTGSSGNGWRNQYKVTYANGYSWETRRDGFGELTKVEHAKTANQVTTSLYTEEQYSHDGLGNIAGLTKRMKSASGAVLSTKTYGYAYDGVSRITQETLPSGVKPSYTYDERGNRLSFQPQTNPNPAVRNLYRYNARNQVSSAIQLSGGSTTSQAVYTYYGDGLRATKTVNGKQTRYVYLNGNVIDELDSSGNVKARNVWGNELLFRRDVTAGKAGYYFYNGHGDVTRVQDSANESVDLATYDYDIWGNVTASTASGNFSNPFRYTGEIQDDESGLIYLRARYYDPSEGRFLTEDTVEGQVDNPLTLNLYTYVHNNPLIYVDPSGNCAILPTGNYFRCSKSDEYLLKYKKVYLTAKSDFDRKVLSDGARYIRQTSNNWSVQETDSLGDYTFTFNEMYALWLSGNEELYRALDESTRSKLLYQLKHDIVTNEAKKGFPTVLAGLESGLTLATLGELRLANFAKPKSGWNLDLQLFANTNLLKGITKKLLDNDRVKIELFRNGKYNGYTLEKDRAINSGSGTHGGSFWKLKSRNGETWTLDKNGKILRKK